MKITSKLPNVGTTIFTEMSALANAHNAVNLSQGFPNFQTDQRLSDLVTEAMNKGLNQYAPMRGVLVLREEISLKFKRLYNSTYNPESEIVITSGATQAIFTIISAFVHQDDEVILFKPAYDCYQPAIELNKGRVVPIQLEHPNYRVDWQEVEGKINSKTKMIVVNTPQNPSGTIFSKEDMLNLERLTKGTNIIVLSDEVYEHMIYDDQSHQSVCLFPELKKRSFITASFGKTFHNTGWKIGYCCAPSELMDEFVKVHQFNVFSANHPIQVALAEYLKTPEHYLELPKFFQQKRDLFLSLIQDANFDFIPSQASYFQLLDYSKITDENDVDFAIRLTKEFKIASIPMSVFNENNLDFKVLRFCFAKTDETLKAAAAILNQIA